MKLTVTAFLFLASSMFAQGPPPRGVHDNMTTMTTLLSLNTSQQAVITKAHSDARTATKSLQTSMRAAHTSLQAAIKSNDLGAIDTLTAQIGTLHAQELSINSKAEAAVYATLTPEQQAKYTTLHSGFGPGGFGGPGGPRRN